MTPSEEKLHIYPNPSTGIFNIKLPETNSRNTVISVFNSIGQKLSLTPFSNRNEVITIDLQNQAVGIYFIQVEMAGKTYVTKTSKL